MHPLTYMDHLRASRNYEVIRGELYRVKVIDRELAKLEAIYLASIQNKKEASMHQYNINEALTRAYRALKEGDLDTYNCQYKLAQASMMLARGSSMDEALAWLKAQG